MAEVTGFSKSLGKIKEVPIASVAVAYDCTITYQTYILIFHQVLYIKELVANLICPNQLRANGLQVNECPLQYLPFNARTENSHSILLNELKIPLHLRGIISYFKVRPPTQSEINDTSKYLHIEVTSAHTWEPYNDQIVEDEVKLATTGNTYVEPTLEQRTISVVDISLCSISRALVPNQFLQLLESSIIVRSNQVSSAITKRKGTLTAQELSKRWFIGLPTAERTVKQTTQRGVRDFLNTGGYRKMKDTAHQLLYKHIRTSIYTDTMFSKVKSLRQNTCAQVYITTFHFTKVYPMRTKSDAHMTLDSLHCDVGVFHTIIPDNAKELTEGEFRKKALHAGAQLKPVEAYRHNQNLAESGIRELRRMYRKAMSQTNAPHVLWDRCLLSMAEIRSHTALEIPELGGDTPYTRITGDTCDISHLCEFGWYDRVWWVDPQDKMENRKLGRYLGPSHDIGHAMCSRILTQNGTEISRTSVVPVSTGDLQDQSVLLKIKSFDDKLAESLGERIAGIQIAPEDDIPEFDKYDDDNSEPLPIMNEADEIDLDTHHNFILSKVTIPHGGHAVTGRVVGRKRDHDGNLIGKANTDPLLDTALYNVEFDDGHVEAYSANIIAEGIYEQIDTEGQLHRMIDEIVDHKKLDNALNMEDTDGTKKPTTKGWKICIKWKDGSLSWERLVDIKEGYPIELAEYAVANQISSEPAFSWWVPTMLKQRERMIAKVKTRYLCREEKHGIPLPKTVRDALQLDEESDSTHWADAIKKEMAVILPAVKILDEGQKPPVGYQIIPCHMIFDVKTDFKRKARFVGGGHVTSPPVTQTYASVVSRESVRIGLLYASLNNLNVMSADIQGAYLNAPCKEKVCTMCGAEFGPVNEGRYAIIVKALYGLRSSAFAWREHLSHTLETSLGFEHCLADNDVWMRPGKRLNGDEYYQYVLVHTDDLLVIAEDPKDILNQLDQHYVLKPDSIEEPTIYLGSEVGKYHLPHRPDRPVWFMSSKKYCKEAVRNVKKWLEERGRTLKNKATSVFPSAYRPELDITAYCNDDEGHYYQQQIGVLRWLVELGRIDVAAEVSMLASFTVAPRRGHFDTMLHMFAYLNQHARSKLVLDDTYVHIDDEIKHDWGAFYPKAKELIPDNMPVPRGHPVQQIVFVDADHAADVVTRRSRTGILFYLNSAPIFWYTKRQNSVERSTFGSEFMATKSAVELIKGMRYKLRMMGIPLDGHAHLRVDNMSVVANTSLPKE